MNWNQRKCLVTGGASFIGSHLVEYLLQAGAEVRVADDLSSGKRENLCNVENEIEFLTGDLRHLDFAEQASKGCDVVFHLAADHGGRGYIVTHPASCAGNMALDNIVFDTAVKNGVEHITYASSACVYPTDIQEGKILLTEDMAGFTHKGKAYADEEYGWAKLMGELSLNAFKKQYDVSAAAARLSTAYGPRENESHAMIALIAKAYLQQSPYEIWGNGEQSRGFTHVDDIVTGIILATENISDATAVNVGTDQFISLNQIAEEIFSFFDWEPPDGVTHLLDKPVGVKHRALDGTMAMERCGWSARVSLTQGVAGTANWYAQHNNPQEVRQKLGSLLMQR